MTASPRRLAVALTVGLACAAILVFNGDIALAQCPMCGKAAEYAGTKPGAAYRTFVTAVLVLLAPALGILGGFGALLWRHRGDGADSEANKRSPEEGKR